MHPILRLLGIFVVFFTTTAMLLGERLIVLLAVEPDDAAPEAEVERERLPVLALRALAPSSAGCSPGHASGGGSAKGLTALRTEAGRALERRLTVRTRHRRRGAAACAAVRQPRRRPRSPASCWPSSVPSRRPPRRRRPAPAAPPPPSLAAASGIARAVWNCA